MLVYYGILRYIKVYYSVIQCQGKHEEEEAASNEQSSRRNGSGMRSEPLVCLLLWLPFLLVSFIEVFLQKGGRGEG